MPTMSFIDAAYHVLKAAREPLSAREITAKALKQRLITTKGKTPSATMGACVYVEIKEQGPNARFAKVGRGKFGLSEWASQPERHFRPHSFKDAAYKALRSAKEPLRVHEITNLGLEKGWLRTSGRTPDYTMGAQLYMDVKDKGHDSLFVQLGKSTFGLREWGLEVLEEEMKRQEKAEPRVLEKKRSIVGDPINFKGLIYGPLNENGVIFLFSKIHDQLDIKIEAIQATFPDARGRRKKSTKGWEDIWIEFEYKSSTFKSHSHDPKECDIIVCWEHDWEDCPLEVIELKRWVHELRSSD